MHLVPIPSTVATFETYFSNAQLVGFMYRAPTVLQSSVHQGLVYPGITKKKIVRLRKTQNGGFRLHLN